jgi:hypothetical protein
MSIGIAPGASAGAGLNEDTPRRASLGERHLHITWSAASSVSRSATAQGRVGGPAAMIDGRAAI